MESISCATEPHQRSWGNDWEADGPRLKSSTRCRVNAGLSEQCGWSPPQFGSRCLCWWQYWHIDVINKPSYGTSNQSPTTSWRGAPELFQQWEHSMPKATSKLSAVPSTRPASNSNAPVAVHKFTTWKCGRYSDTLWLWNTPKREKQRQFLLTITEFSSWKRVSKEKSLILRKVPEPLCHGLVKLRMLKVIYDINTSACTPGNSRQDFENLDFKIARGCNFKTQVTTVEGKAQSETRPLSGRQIAWMIYDFFKISGDNEAILDLTDLSKVQLKNDSVQAFDAKSDEVLSAVTDRLTDNILESLYKRQLKQSEESKYVLQVHAHKTTFGDKKDNYCR